MAKKNAFLVLHENAPMFDMLTDAQLGMLFRAVCQYAIEGTAREINDPMVKMAFSVMQGQLDRNAARYREICEKRAEFGRRGGAPKGNQNARKNPKQAKQPDPDPNPNPNPDPKPNPKPNTNPDPVPVCERVPDPEASAAQGTETHTHRKPFSVEAVLQEAARNGFQWDQAEALSCYEFNEAHGFPVSLSYAVRRWEQNRPRYQKQIPGKRPMSQQEIDEMNEYLSLANRFAEDAESSPDSSELL